jgi:DNA-binding FrmR family transcriptional regulator
LPFLSINSGNGEFQGGGIVEVSASDRELIAVMRQYFAAKAELESLKAQLETARQTAGEAIGVFYDPRQNTEHAADLQRLHRLKGEMASLMQRAEAWGRAALAADRNGTSEMEAEPEEWQSFERRADAFFGA